MGHGTVGRAFREILEAHQDEWAPKVGEPLAVTRILVRQPERHAEVRDRLTTNPWDILDDPTIEIVVEVMGGLEPARTYMVEALRRGKMVVTANKEVMAEAGGDLFRAADAGGGDVFFEASVGGGMPVVQGLKRGLQANRVHRVTGILNGTTNYILTRMATEGTSFAEALAQAQSQGYAEADPSSDVDGMDAARKLAILASIGFQTRVRPEGVAVVGIAGLSADDLAYGNRRGWVLKLVADARQVDGRLQLSVGPVFLPKDHPLAHVDGSYNAVVVDADPVGQVMFYGPGAGGGPTASAVLGDVIEAAQYRRANTRAIGCTCHRTWPLVAPEDREEAFYWRMQVVDRPGTLHQIVGLLAARGISLGSVDQRPLPDALAHLVLVTHRCRFGDVMAAVGDLEDHPAIVKMGWPLPVWGEM